MKVFVFICLIGYSLAQFPSSKFPYNRPTQIAPRPQVPSVKPEYYKPQRPNYEQYGNSNSAQILKDFREVNPDGSFVYEFETSDGTRAEASGYLKGGNGKDEAFQEIKGSFQYVGDDGKTYGIQYIANEEGYQPVGDHLPTPPPIPEAILRSLEYNAKNPQQDEYQYNKQPKYASANPDYYTRYTKK